MSLTFALGVVGAAASAGLLFYATRAFRQYRVVGTLRPTRIAVARPGQFVDLWGKVVAMRSLVSPHCAKPCVYFHTVREAWHRDVHHDGDDHSKAIKLDDRSDFVEFLVDDGSGRAMVAPVGADFIVEQDYHDPEFVSVSVRAGPVRFGRAPADGQVRVEETYLEPGDRVHVLGTVRRIDSVASPAGEAGATLVIEGARAPVFIVSDRPKPQLAETLAMRWQASGAAAFVALAVAVGLFWSAPHEAPRAQPREESSWFLGTPPNFAAGPRARPSQPAPPVASPAAPRPGKDAGATWTARVESRPLGAKIYRNNSPDPEPMLTPASMAFEGDDPVVIVIELPDGRRRTKTLTPEDSDFIVEFEPRAGP